MVVLLDIITTMLLFAIALIDLDTMEIPDELNMGLGICGLVSAFVSPEIALMQRCIGAFCVSVPMAVLCFFIKDAFGGGDMKLTMAMGFFLGWRACLIGFFFAVCIGGAQAAVLLIRKKARYGEKTPMAFGPALCGGMFLAQLFGTKLFHWYFGLFV